MLSLCSLRSHNTTLVRLAARPRFARSRFARLLCSLRLPPRSPLLTCALTSLAPAASPACFARLADCSTRLSRCCSLRSSSLLPSLASLGPLLLCARSARCLASCALALLVSSPAARSARRLDCGSALCSPLAALPAVRSSLAVYLLDLSHSPCPPRLLQHFSARASSLPRSSQSLADLHYFPYWSCGFIFLGSRKTLRVSSRRAKTASSDALRS